MCSMLWIVSSNFKEDRVLTISIKQNTVHIRFKSLFIGCVVLIYIDNIHNGCLFLSYVSLIYLSINNYRYCTH